ncbi:MAG: hypothetical protein JW720_01820 [Sedimentisphaerales bacterium]|nr:hypothetical protein [Sedimentisphaerales bacterium]
MKSQRTTRWVVLWTLSLFSMPALLAGCGGSDKCVGFQDEVQALTDEKAELEKQLEQTEAENAELEKRMKVLAALPGDVKGESLYRIEQVTITSLTNLYDKDKDGKKEKLIVYLQPLDQDGDLVKAAGAVDVELWDLDNADGEAKLGDWQVTPEELRKLWFSAIMGTNYRLTFDVGERVKDVSEPLTVKVAFTDYLTGKVFKEQMVIEAQGE